ncbi:hypothetical protein GGR57DRAFT_439814 [Xylariaceae sp. FL1272]|nr:hypothetical protein GGR57DRAFT_439814 [Xylariaceae sp. FL1272]
MKFLQHILLLAPFAVARNLDRRGREVYDGYKVVRVATPRGYEDLEARLDTLEAIDLTHTHGHDESAFLDIAIPAENLEALSALNYFYEVTTEDLGVAIALEGELEPFPGLESDNEVAKVGAAAALPSLTWFNAYHAYADHLTFLSSLQAAFPSNSELFTVGASFEGRAIQGIHLWGTGGKGSKPAIYWHGNVHAREWITSMTVEYLTYQIINNYANDTTVKTVLNNYDFHIIPVVNPDGFVYTQTSTRLWRKNRQTRSGTTAVGTDINRNWPYQWSGSGSSTSPSAEDYRGVAAGDTPENAALRKYGDTLAAGKGIKFYIDFHSYGQYVLTPYGYSCSATASNSATQNSLAARVGSAIATAYGTRYTTGPVCDTLYAVNGGSNDYFTDVSKATYAWAIEMRDTGAYGFTLPANQILPNSIEQWNGQKFLFANI